eukprot:1157763-Pelagomonas_calceolata.AAC.2
MESVWRMFVIRENASKRAVWKGRAKERKGREGKGEERRGEKGEEGRGGGGRGVEMKGTEFLHYCEELAGKVACCSFFRGRTFNHGGLLTVDFSEGGLLSMEDS